MTYVEENHLLRGVYVEENHLLRGRYAKISTDDRGLYFFTEGRRPEVKKSTPRSEVDYLCLSTEKEGCFPYNFDLLRTLTRNCLEVIFKLQFYSYS